MSIWDPCASPELSGGPCWVVLRVVEVVDQGRHGRPDTESRPAKAEKSAGRGVGPGLTDL